MTCLLWGGGNLCTWKLSIFNIFFDILVFIQETLICTSCKTWVNTLECLGIRSKNNSVEMNLLMWKEASQPHTKGAQLPNCLPTHLNVPKKKQSGVLGTKSQDQENQHYQLTTLAIKSTFATNHNINTMTMVSYHNNLTKFS
jgi:hypothetical protein